MAEWKRWEGRIVARRFHLQRYLGGSARSGVFLTETGDGTTAAIKLAPLDSGAAETWTLRRELASGLSHAGLLRILEFGSCEVEGESLVFAVMEYADEDLSTVLPSRALDADEVREVVRSVAGTLAYLHEQGFVHGRLRPANILAVEDRIKISSDRLLRIGEAFEDPDDSSSGDGGPPESRQGVTPASDVWSMGAAVVELLTAKPLARKNQSGLPMTPGNLPAPFGDIARRCLCIDPRRRCSLGDIVRALDPPAERLEPVAAAPKIEPKPKPKLALPATESPSSMTAPPWRRMVWLAAAVFAIVLTGAMLKSGRPAAPSVSAAESAQPAPAPSVPPTTAAAPIRQQVSKPSPLELRATPPDQKSGEILPTPAPTTAPARTRARTPSSIAGDVVDGVQPEVPAQYLATIRGAVKIAVRVHVDRTGSVTSDELAASSGGRYFDRVALDTARRWKFQPARDGSDAVESTKIVRFEFRPTGGSASAGDR